MVGPVYAFPPPLEFPQHPPSVASILPFQRVVANRVQAGHHLVRLQRRFAGLAREDVRMAPHQLVGNARQRVGDREMACFRLELRHEDSLEQEIASLLNRPPSKP